jgi:hypothetical protein
MLRIIRPQQQPDHEAGLDSGRAILAEERRDFAVDPVPIDPASELNQLVLHVDDLVQPRPEQVVDPVALCFFSRIVPSDAPQNHGQQRKENHKPNCRVWAAQAPIPAISNALASEKQTLAQSLRGLFTGGLQ